MNLIFVLIAMELKPLSNEEDILALRRIYFRLQRVGSTHPP